MTVGGKPGAAQIDLALFIQQLLAHAHAHNPRDEQIVRAQLDHLLRFAGQIQRALRNGGRAVHPLCRHGRQPAIGKLIHIAP